MIVTEKPHLATRDAGRRRNRARIGGWGLWRGAFALTLLACSGDSAPPTEPPPPPTPVPTTVIVSPSSAALASLGATVKLTAEVRDQNGNPMPGTAVAWGSSADTVAAVDGTGLVTAVANGAATITATAASVSGTAAVTVEQVAAATRVVPDSLTFDAVGDTASLAATVTDANGHAIEGVAVEWASGDTAVATVVVGETGVLVTAVGAGRTSVVASAGETEGGATVSVEQLADSISVAPATLAFSAIGDTARVSATVLDANGHLAEGAVTAWSSGDTTVATVDAKGLITATGPGATAVTAASGQVAAMLKVEVAQVPAEIGIEPTSLVFTTIGDTATLSAAVVDANGHEIEGAVATWSSADPSVASVDANGLVTAVALGSTLVSAASGPVTASASVEILSLSTDRAVLEYLFRVMGGPSWKDRTNWLTPAPLSTWHGVDTDSDGRVSFLSLRGNHLTGPIPDAIGRLHRLFILDFSSNRLQGAIPSSIANLGRLRDLILGHNPLEGRLPPELGRMGALRYLHLESTKLHGPIPETFAGLRLDAFYFGATSLCVPTSLRAWLATVASGTEGANACVPDTPDRDVLVDLYHATGGPRWERNGNWLGPSGINTWDGVEANDDGYVTSLSLAYNNLVGSISAELGDLAHLENLWLYGNRLTGAIPASLGRLSRLRNLSLASNGLDGPIPTELGDLSSLDTLFLSSNLLSGAIPPELGKLSGLKVMAMFENRLTGPLPSQFGNLVSLRELWLTDNLLEGPLPKELGNMRSLEDLNLLRNRVSGPIPPELGALASLRTLTLSNNALEGRIPGELGSLAALERLHLARNQLSGPIPRELGNLASIETLWLFLNDLSGPIPPELGNLRTLKRLAMGDNRLSGPLPPEFGKMVALTDLQLGRGNLSGPIPPELANLPALTDLGLHSNDFSGPLPPELGNIRTLESLSVVYNEDLTGLLPRSLMSLPALSSLAFYSTGICAQIDDEFQGWMRTLSDARPADCDVETVERYALADLHDRTAGSSWTSQSGWNGDGPLGSWHGIATEGGRVRELTLANNGLRGPLPAELANLTELRVLDLRGNDLTGELPTAFAALSGLAELRVPDNARLDGVLPFDLTRLRSVKVLHHTGTGLCASPSSTFQTWYSGIDDTSGAICGNPDEVAVSLPIVYLTQSVQSPSRSVRLVADRDALLRVFVTGDQPRAFFEPTVRATFLRGGREVHQVTIERHGDEIATVADEGELDLSYNTVIPARHIVPGTEMVVEVDPDGVIPQAPGSVMRFPAAGAEPLNVVEVPPMEVTVVPVLEAAEPDSSIFDWTRGLSADGPQMGLFRYAFPFADINARARDSYVTSLDLTSSEGQWGLVLELEALRAAENGTGYYYGAAASVNGYVRGIARLGAWVSIGKAWDTELAHEIGHNLDLRHAPCGGALGTDPEFPYADGSIGVWGYDFRNASVVSPERRRDIMGYCYERGWLSDFYFEKVIDYRERVEGEARARAAAAGPPTDMLVLWGGVVEGEPRLEPAFPMRTAPRLPDEAGPYRLEGRGTDGRTEFSLDFAPGEDQFGNSYFFFTIPIEPGWRESLETLTLTGPEGVVTTSATEPRGLSVVRDRATGRIRGILRDVEPVLPAALGTRGDLVIEATRNLGDAVRLRR